MLEREARMNVGYLRQVIADLPDDASIFPDWAEPPADDYPGVEIDNFVVGDTNNDKFLSIRVRLFHLNEPEQESPS